jgi:hypothetical protein
MSLHALKEHLAKIGKLAEEIGSASRYLETNSAHYGLRIRSDADEIQRLVKKAKALLPALHD